MFCIALPDNTPVRPGYKPIPIGTVVKVVRSAFTWELGTVYRVIGYGKAFTRQKNELGWLTVYRLKAYPTDRFFSYLEAYDWQLERQE